MQFFKSFDGDLISTNLTQHEPIKTIIIIATYMSQKVQMHGYYYKKEQKIFFILTPKHWTYPKLSNFTKRY